MADDGSTTLYSPEGIAHSVAPEDVADFTNSGYTTEPSQQVQDNNLNSTLGEQTKGFLEGAANTATLGLTTKAETALGVNPEDINRRRSTFGHALGMAVPIVVASALATPAAGATLGALESGAVAGASALGAIGGAAATGAAEMAIMQAGDENSKWLANDPQQTVGNAISNIGMSALIGGAFGGVGKAAGIGLGKLADSQLGQVANDFKASMADKIANPEPGAKILDELQQADNFAKEAQFNVDGGLKDKVVQNLAEDLNPEKVNAKAMDLLRTVDKNIAKVKAEPGIYQGARLASFEGQRNRLAQELSASQSPANAFQALNSFKQAVGKLTKWGVGDNIAESEGAGLIKDVYGHLQRGLEDNSVWGKLGDFQASSNEAVSDLIKSGKVINSLKTLGPNGERILDPQKVANFAAKAANGSAEIKASGVSAYADAIQNYAKTIDAAHAAIGIENPNIAPSMQATLQAAGKPTLGGKLANSVYNGAINKMAGKAVGAGVGGAIGGAPGAIIGEMVGGPFLDSVMPGILKPLMSSAVSGPGFGAASKLGLAAVKGAKIMQGVSDAVIKGGTNKYIDNVVPDKSATEKLSKWVSSANDNPNSMLNASGRVGDYLPDHAAAIGAKVAQVQQYLAAQEPKIAKNGIFDNEIKPTKHAEAAYQRTLQIAEQPLIVAKHIKDGTLIPKDAIDLNALHPDVHKQLIQSLTNSTIEHHADGNRVPFKVQMGLSMLSGQPLSSNFSPQGIQAAQAVFNQQSAGPQGPPTRNKKSTSSLTKEPELYQTQGQQRTASRQSNKE